MGAARERARPARCSGLLGGLVALAVLTAGCTKAAGVEPGAGSAGASPGPTPQTNLPEAGGAGAGPEPAAAGASPLTQTCAEAIGAQLRERTTVGANRLVTVFAGPLSCPSVGIWAGQFSLDSDPALDPAPQFGAAYTGGRPLAVRLPATSGRCKASAVFFTVDANAAGDREAATHAARQVRSELADWPAGSTAVVPGGAILRGRSSVVLAGTVAGDPATCSPGESVSIPFASPGDCWTVLPSGATGAPAATAASSATRFRQTACGTQHTHEVYWAERLTPEAYLAEGKRAGLGAAAWARRRAGEVCAERSTAIDLSDGVTRADIYLEYLWPGALRYPPSKADGWAKAEIVCLARRQDGRVSTRQLLRR